MAKPTNREVSSSSILKGEFDRASRDEKLRASRELIRRASSQTALLVIEPVPFLDAAAYTRMQRRMVQAIARLWGHDLDDEGARRAFGTIRGRVVRPNLTIALAKLIAFVPILPDIWAGSIGYALTSTIGELADRSFRTGRRMPSAELEASFDRIFRETHQAVSRAKRNQLRALFRNRQVRRQIKDLKRAYRAGEMDSEEAVARSEMILG
jgi:uncharacterized protein (DUF697 family)